MFAVQALESIAEQTGGHTYTVVLHSEEPYLASNWAQKKFSQAGSQGGRRPM